jgi:hypothetical protein
LQNVPDTLGGIRVTYVPSFAAAGSAPARVLPKWTFSAFDDSVRTDRQLQITVVNVEKAPVLAPIGAKSVREGANLSFTLSATDLDGTVPTLLSPALPEGANLTALGGGQARFDWLPQFDQAGVYPVLFIARDITGRADSELVVITVTEFGNHAPVIFISALDTLVIKGNSLSISFSAVDVDLTTPVISVLNLPRNAVFTNLGGAFGRVDFTPDSTQTDSSYTITLRASDESTFVVRAVNLHVLRCILGDIDRDELLTSADVVRLINYVFLGLNPPLEPFCSADLNNDGVIDATDVVKELNLVFLGIPPVTPPSFRSQSQGEEP